MEQIEPIEKKHWDMELLYPSMQFHIPHTALNQKPKSIQSNRNRIEKHNHAS